jgi:hypothetical protein
MKRRSPWLAFAACALVTGSQCRASQPTRRTGDLSRVQVFAYPNGETGFFDRETGSLYVYGSDLKECVASRKVTMLGETLAGIAQSPKEAFAAAPFAKDLPKPPQLAPSAGSCTGS